MPMLEIFATAAEADAGAAATDLAMTDAGASALGAASTYGGISDAAMLGGEYGPGITSAGDVGAGAGTNAAVDAQQLAAKSIPNSGITSAPASFDSFGNPAQVGSSAATMADPTGLAQTQLDANVANAGSGIGSGISSALKEGWSAFRDLPGPVQFLGGMAAINALGLNKPQGQFNNPQYNGPLSKYHLSPDFKGMTANPQNYQYTPHYAGGGILDAAGGGPVEQMSNANSIGANTGYPQADIHTGAYATPWQTPVSQNVLSGPGDVNVDPYTGEQKLASGGIARFDSGGLADSLNYYENMMNGAAGQQMAQMQTPAAGSRDVGIYHDSDPDTMYLDPVTAAQVRMAKVNKRANMQTPAMQKPTPMGQLNLKPQGAAAPQQQQFQEAAKGGIMEASSHLGGYAAGGQPRLLKGPGDGMSDDIPATIADKQPARLADGEFVVPADVVSHLGNGSTDAGAKKLHHMMSSVRKARTGRQAQGKQINADKFMPK
jgi:hypothetical protein